MPGLESKVQIAADISRLASICSGKNRFIFRIADNIGVFADVSNILVMIMVSIDGFTRFSSLHIVVNHP